MQKIAILYDASQAVLSTFELDEVLAKILSIVRDYFQVQHSAVLLLDPRTQELHVHSQLGWDVDSGHVLLPGGEGLTGAAIRLKRPIYAPDVGKDPRYVETMKGTRSELVIPLMVQDAVVGVLDCQSHRENCFEKEIIDLLTLFSTQASIAIQNARLYSLERRRAEQLEAINAIARQTTALLDEGELLTKICTLLKEAFPVDQVAVLMMEHDRLVVRAQHGQLTARLLEGDELSGAGGLCGRAMLTQKTVVENDVRTAGDYLPGFEETRSEICIPLISLGETLGVLTLESASPGAFQAADVQPLESVAGICATAIQNARNFERVQKMAYIDGLTGIFNRRFFEMRIGEELERTRRYPPACMSVVLIDIDNFKQLNDEFGHLLGDEVMRQVSAIFNQQLRKVDVVSRYGGDEFALVFPETPGEAAVHAAEKLRRIIAAFPFPGVPRPVTVSAGVAESPTHACSRDELVKAADAALYAAKQAGRNCVVCAIPKAKTAQQAI